MMCQCKVAVVLVEGDGEHVAREVECPDHGYQSTCYVCDPSNSTTERCRGHGIVLKFVGAPVYEGRAGWPGRDLTQHDLDTHRGGLDKAELLAYRPKLYEEAEEKSGKKSRSGRRRSNSQIQSRTGPDEHQDDDDAGGEPDKSLHPVELRPGKD